MDLVEQDGTSHFITNTNDRNTFKEGDFVTVNNMRSWGWAVGMYEVKITKKRKQEWYKYLIKEFI
jgi:hypothetical protein